MIKCPLCQYENEDGSLFCDQCKADLGVAAQAMPADQQMQAAPEPEMALAVPVVMATAVPIETAVPFEAGAPALEAPGAPVAEESAPVAAPAEPAGTALPAGTQPKLVVIRGLKINTEYPIYEGQNFIGRTDEKPVDIDIEDQEPPDRIWSSRQHACVNFENGQLEIEDLNSSNGTFVNRTRVYPGQKRPLSINDVVQIGTVQMRVKP
jgi:hypothetical protein